MKQEKIYIYGKHAVEEALKNSPKSVTKVYLASKEDRALISLIQKYGISIANINESGATGGLDSGAKHQGVIGKVSLAALVRPYEEFITSAKIDPHTSFALLGEIQDPHNVGAIIRSAAAFGLSGILIPEHNQAGVTGSVVKVSAGMAFSIPLVSIGNVNTTIRDLKKRGFWIYGLAGEGKNILSEEKFDAPAVFVLGNEGAGLRAETRKECDVLLSVPMHPRCESLNVAASGAVVFYEWSKKHPRAIK